ncbi:MAG: PfkB family carbohydrate kinase [Patescibacteria group bacterium]|jgi:sugar/nucleoside kinase (ribokinase family)
MYKKNNNTSHYDIVTIGTALQDTMFYTSDAEIIKNPKHDPTKVKLIGFEYGAKIHSNNVQYHFGGGAANTAVCCARLGLRTAIITCLGNDMIGERVMKLFKQERVAYQHVQIDTKKNSGSSFIVVDSKTDEHVAFVNYGASKHLQVTASILKKIKTKWFYVPSLSVATWPQLMKKLIATKANIAWNPGAIQLEQPQQIIKLLPHVTVLNLNKDEAVELALKTGFTLANLASLMKHLYQFGMKLLLVTDGRNGAQVFDGKQFYFAKPNNDKPIDTTGAGDSFGASFIAGLIKYPNNINLALCIATVNTTANVAKTGAQNGLLTWSQLRQQLQRK